MTNNKLIVLQAFIFCCISNFSFAQPTEIWGFVFAGQSNMGGRGAVYIDNDTTKDNRILTINAQGEIVKASEPINIINEPVLAGVSCMYSFGREMIKNIPDHVKVLLIPTPLGSSSLAEWNNDEVIRGINVLTNFKEKVAIGKQNSIIKGVLWHQGESEDTEELRESYTSSLDQLFSTFRQLIGDENLPIIMGELKPFKLSTIEGYNDINRKMHLYADDHFNTSVISSSDFDHKGEYIHYDSKSLRLMGRRYAHEMINILNNIH